MGKRYTMIPKHTVKCRVRMLSETEDYNHRLMNIPEFWKVTRGHGIKVAIMDSGVPNHIDLGPVEPHLSVIPGYYEDLNGHATHVGGVIAAIAGNGIGVAGIAPDVEDHYVACLDQDGGGDIEGLIDSIYWSVDQLGADIINMSLGVPAGAPRFRELEAACNYAVSQGVPIIAAAGNEAGRVGQPAVYDCTIAIAAVNNRKEHARFSNTGPEVDFAAGGVDVYSTYLRNTYARLSGTSMAAPAVCGIAALILSKHKQQGVRLSPEELREHIRRIAYDIGPEGFDPRFGHGIPVYGHINANDPDHIPVPQDPGPEPQPRRRKGAKTMGPNPDCAYWKLWKSFIQAVDADLVCTENLRSALASGITRLANHTELIDRDIRDA